MQCNVRTGVRFCRWFAIGLFSLLGWQIAAAQVIVTQLANEGFILDDGSSTRVMIDGMGSTEGAQEVAVTAVPTDHAPHGKSSRHRLRSCGRESTRIGVKPWASTLGQSFRGFVTLRSTSRSWPSIGDNCCRKSVTRYWRSVSEPG